MTVLRVALPAQKETELNVAVDQHEVTSQELTVATSVCHKLKALGIRCQVHRNPIFYFKNEIWRPDIYIPALGLIIEVDGRSHERCDGRYLDQQRRDERRDLFYKENLGVWVFIVPNWVAHNNFELGMHLDNLLTDRNLNRPSKAQYLKTAKAITSSRQQFRFAYPFEAMNIKSGPAGSHAGFKMQYGFGGFVIEIRPKRNPDSKPKRKGHKKPR